MLSTRSTASSLGLFEGLPRELRDQIWAFDKPSASPSTFSPSAGPYHYRIPHPSSTYGDWVQNNLPLDNPPASREMMQETQYMAAVYAPSALRIQIDNRGWKSNVPASALFSRSAVIAERQPVLGRFEKIQIALLPPDAENPTQLLATYRHVRALLGLLTQSQQLSDVSLTLLNTCVFQRQWSLPPITDPDAPSAYFPLSIHGDRLKRSIGLLCPATSEILGWSYYLSDIEVLLRPFLQLRHCSTSFPNAIIETGLPGEFGCEGIEWSSFDSMACELEERNSPTSVLLHVVRFGMVEGVDVPVPGIGTEDLSARIEACIEAGLQGAEKGTEEDIGDFWNETADEAEKYGHGLFNGLDVEKALDTDWRIWVPLTHKEIRDTAEYLGTRWDLLGGPISWRTAASLSPALFQ